MQPNIKSGIFVGQIIYNQRIAKETVAGPKE